MSFIKKTREYFYGIFPVNTKGKQTGFSTNNQPNQSRFEEFMASVTWFTRSEDRARVSAAGALKDEQGLAVAASNVQAKANTAQLADRTILAQPHQLPTSEAVSDTILNSGGNFVGNVLEVVADITTLTRNQYKFNLTGVFKAWLEPLLETSGVSYGTLSTCLAYRATSSGVIAGVLGNPQASSDVKYRKEGNHLHLNISKLDLDLQAGNYLAATELIAFDITSQLVSESLGRPDLAFGYFPGSALITDTIFTNITALNTPGTAASCAAICWVGEISASTYLFIRPTDINDVLLNVNVEDAYSIMGATSYEIK